MHCEDIIEYMSQSLDGCLDAEQEQLLQAHLEGCSNCAEQFDALKQTVALLHREEPVSAPGDLVARVREALDSKPIPFIGWNVFNHPQVAVALAAGLVIMVGIYAVVRFPEEAGLKSEMAIQRSLEPAASKAAYEGEDKGGVEGVGAEDDIAIDVVEEIQDLSHAPVPAPERDESAVVASKHLGRLALPGAVAETRDGVDDIFDDFKKEADLMVADKELKNTRESGRLSLSAAGTRLEAQSDDDEDNREKDAELHQQITRTEDRIWQGEKVAIESGPQLRIGALREARAQALEEPRQAGSARVDAPAVTLDVAKKSKRGVVELDEIQPVVESEGLARAAQALGADEASESLVVADIAPADAVTGNMSRKRRALPVVRSVPESRQVSGKAPAETGAGSMKMLASAPEEAVGRVRERSASEQQTVRLTGSMRVKDQVMSVLSASELVARRSPVDTRVGRAPTASPELLEKSKDSSMAASGSVTVRRMKSGESQGLDVYVDVAVEQLPLLYGKLIDLGLVASLDGALLDDPGDVVGGSGAFAYLPTQGVVRVHIYLRAASWDSVPAAGME